MTPGLRRRVFRAAMRPTGDFRRAGETSCARSAIDFAGACTAQPPGVQVANMAPVPLQSGVALASQFECLECGRSDLVSPFLYEMTALGDFEGRGATLDDAA